MKILLIFIISWVIMATAAVILAIVEFNDLMRYFKPKSKSKAQSDHDDQSEDSTFWKLFTGIFISLSTPIIGIAVTVCDIFTYLGKEKVK